MSRDDQFDSDYLSRVLFEHYRLDPGIRWFVAFSGGLDSTVLLHALNALEFSPGLDIVALHANHGLNNKASAWELHCRAECAKWHVPFKSVKLNIPDHSSVGLEAAAREARYRWFETQIQESSALLTAHHFQDQVETVLGNLFRGSGIHGVAGMKPSRKLGPGKLIRPLLGTSKASLEVYAREHGLQWIEDPMNEDTAYSRNFIRHKLLPEVETKWPGASRAIVRAADLWRESSELLDEIALEDLSGIETRSLFPFHLLSVPDLRRLSAHRRTNLLRKWIRKNNFNAPTKAQLLRVEHELIRDEPKVTHIVTWRGVQFRRYRNWLYLSGVPDQQAPEDFVWKPDSKNGMTLGNWRLTADNVLGDGISARICARKPLEFRTRRGGEKCLLPGRQAHTKVKNLMQSAGIPPWFRDRHPLIFVDGTVAGVVGLCYCTPFAATRDEAGVTFNMRVLESGEK